MDYNSINDRIEKQAAANYGMQTTASGAIMGGVGSARLPNLRETREYQLLDAQAQVARLTELIALHDKNPDFPRILELLGMNGKSCDVPEGYHPKSLREQWVAELAKAGDKVVREKELLALLDQNGDTARLLELMGGGRW